MTAHDQPDAAQKIRVLIQSLQQDDRLRAMEQLVVLSLQLGAASEPLSAPGLQTVSQEAVKAVIRELNGVISRQRDVAARLAAENPHSVAPVPSRVWWKWLGWIVSGGLRFAAVRRLGQAGRGRRACLRAFATRPPFAW